MKSYGKEQSMEDSICELTVPVPTINKDELLIKVKAIGVGIHDEYFHSADVSYPYVIGIEASGVIEEIGENVNDKKVGERIAFISMMQPKGGTWAEYCVISKDSLILKIPENLSFEEASIFPVAGNTVLKALKEVDLKKDETLFIAGGAGALGTLLIQIAHKRGIRVIASASKHNHEYMESLGSEYYVDYHDEDWQEQVLKIFPQGVDGAIGIHPGSPKEIMPIVKEGGTLVAVSGDTFETERNITLKGIFNNIDVRSELVELFNQIAKGEIKQTISEVFPFDRALEALAQVKTRHTKGKLVIRIDD